MTDITNTPEAQQFAQTALRWLNMMVNQIRPFTLKELKNATKEADGNVSLNVVLETQAFPGKDFEFSLVLNPSVDNPTALVKHQQLN